MQVRRFLSGIDSSCAAGGLEVGMLAQRLDDFDDGAVLEKRQLPSPELIERRPERFGSNGDLGMQLPGSAEVLKWRSHYQ